jgi:hypothetical protein
MWQSIPSLDVIVQGLSDAFTEPSMETHVATLLGWLMCPGKRTEYRVFETIHADEPVSRDQRHPFDRYYNFFSRSAWTVCELSREVAHAVVSALASDGPLYLVVDDTLLHKRGEHVYGLGWFYDAVASTEARPVTAPGNNWAVVGIAIPVPDEPQRFLCLPLQARLHLAGEEHPSCPDLAASMVQEIATWFPDRPIVLVGDGGYSAHQLLEPLPQQVKYVGLVRMDAELYDPQPPRQPAGKPGRKPKKGLRLPNPRGMLKPAGKAKAGKLPDGWQEIETSAYGKLWVHTRLVLWPKVCKLRPIRIVVIHDPQGKLRDLCLFTTDLGADVAWIIETYGRRSSIEQVFRASKQYLQIEAPHHWCQASIEKLAPWVWLNQSTVILWYLTAGRALPEAEARRKRMGPWDSEWSLRHMLQTLRDAVLEATITPMSSRPEDIAQSLQLLKYCLQLAL